MRRKYFLRGMGIGILITALIFIVVLLTRGNTMSSQEIIAAAEELGMVMPGNTMRDQENLKEANSESETESESTGEDTPQGEAVDATGIPENADGTNVTEATTGEKTDLSDYPSTEDPASTARTTVQELHGEEVKPAPNLTTDPITEANRTERNQSSTVVGTTESAANIVTFTVKGGESSDMVSSNLKKAGLVDNASTFDAYLMSEGYDRAIRPGTYEIRTGSSRETIARTITGR